MTISKTFRAALFGSAAAFTAFAAAPVLAQTADGSVEELVVTGSRIVRKDLTSVQPIQVITIDNIDDKGVTNIADAVNEMPSSGIPINPIGDQGSFGTGRNFINIFNLGTNRTLTLVNGRRFVGGNAASIFTGSNGLGNQVDFNVIPTGLVDRIETIQAGGAAVYGSDAIAGVVNIITKSSFEGVELDGLYGISDKGDAQAWRGRIQAGDNFFDDRLNLFGSYEYSETKALAYTDRDVTARQLAFANNPANLTATDGIPGAIIILNRRIPEITTGGIPYRINSTVLSNILTIPSGTGRVQAQFGPGGVLLPYDPGTFYQASIGSGGQGLNLATLTSLQSPVKRHVFTTFGQLHLTDNIQLNGEFFYNKTNSVEPFNQPIYNSALFGGISGSLQMSTSNPFLPAATRAAIIAQPTPLPADARSPGDVLFFLQRASVDIGQNKTTAESETMRGVLDLVGKFELAGQDFHWNLAANRGHSEGFFSSNNINQTKFLLAQDVVAGAGGAPVCRPLTATATAAQVAAFPGCAPLNMFGDGAPSAAALAYLQVAFVSNFEIDQTVYEANFGGNLIDLPAGPVGFNVGYEYRKEESGFAPNDAVRLGIGRSAPITPINGSFTTKEFYGEGLLPVFGPDFNFFGMHRLEFEGAYRKIDNSQSGKDKSWSYGARWYPVEDLMIRASKSRSFRSPAITELFLPRAEIFTSATDPCDSRNIASGPSPANRTANCQAAFTALGLPANFSLISNIQVATVRGATQGSPTLENEISEQWAAGFVYQPHFAPGLAITFDWTNIDLTNAIFNFNLTSILQVCYDSQTPPAAACDRFRRGTTASGKPGQILGADDPTGNGGPLTGYVNAGYINFQGFTAGINYSFELADLDFMQNVFNANPGKLAFDFDLFSVNKQNTSVTGLGFDLNRDKNEIGNADLQWKLETQYTRDALQVTYTMNYTGRSVFNVDFTPETRLPLSVSDYTVQDIAVTYKLDGVAESLGLDSLKAKFIVKNIMDAEPPFGTTGIGVYDVIGRYFQFGLTGRW